METSRITHKINKRNRESTSTSSNSSCHETPLKKKQHLTSSKNYYNILENTSDSDSDSSSVHTGPLKDGKTPHIDNFFLRGNTTSGKKMADSDLEIPTWAKKNYKTILQIH